MSLQHHNYGDREGEYERGGRQGMGKGEVEREGGEWRGKGKKNTYTSPMGLCQRKTNQKSYKQLKLEHGGVAKSWTRLSNFTFHFHALEKEMATHSSVLAWRIPGIGEPGGLPSMGSHRVGQD